jgi:hypothetical protein
VIQSHVEDVDPADIVERAAGGKRRLLTPDAMPS